MQTYLSPLVGDIQKYSSNGFQFLVLYFIQVVAVKQLDRKGLQGSREFFVEVLMSSVLQHPNLVELVGYCAEGDQRLLVYEFMANGSLENHLLGMFFICLNQHMGLDGSQKRLWTPLDPM